MARSFTRSSSHYIGATGLSQAQYPLCVGCRFKESVTTNNHRLVCFGHNSTSTPWAIMFVGNTIGNVLVWNVNNAGNAAVTTNATTGGWNTGIAWSTNRTSHGAVLNGDWANRGTGSLDSGASSTMDSFDIGRLNNGGSGNQHFDGDIAEAFAMTTIPTQAEVEAYNLGWHPLTIWPLSGFVVYQDLIRDINKPGVGLTLTNNGSTVSAHDPKARRIIFPTAPPLIADGGGGGGIAPHMAYYRRLRAG